MNFKILLFLKNKISGDNIKKFRIDEGTYNLGSDKHNDIFLDDENVGKQHLIVEVDKTGENVSVLIMKKRKGTYLNGKIKKADEKFQVNHKDKITFEDSNMELVFKITEIVRERSRSRSIETNKKISSDKIKKDKIKEKQKEDSDDEKTDDKKDDKKDKTIIITDKHIKSEVIWNSVEFDNTKKKDKFLRLLGAGKNKNKDTIQVEEDPNLSAKIKGTFQKIAQDLEQQFLNSRGRK